MGDRAPSAEHVWFSGNYATWEDARRSSTGYDLCRVFDEIAKAKKARVESVASLTWSRNVRSHLLVWDYLRRTKRGELIPATMLRELDHLAVLSTSGERRPSVMGPV